MPKQISDERVSLVLLDTPPDDPTAITAVEFDAGVRLECRVMDYRLSATGSDSIDQSELCNATNATAPGRSNYEGSLTVFRYLDGTGAADSENDVAWEAVKEKGTFLYLVEREGVEYTEDGAADQEYSYYEVITDDPQKPSDRQGFIRREVPLFVQKAVENQVLVAGV